MIRSLYVGFLIAFLFVLICTPFAWGQSSDPAADPSA